MLFSQKRSEGRVHNEAAELEYLRSLLLEQRRQTTADIQTETAAASRGDYGVEDVGDMSESNLVRSAAFDVASRESKLIQDIDEALRRIDEGTCGQCVRCGKPIDEERLKAMPTARYDAACQATIEAAQGTETSSL